MKGKKEMKNLEKYQKNFKKRLYGLLGILDYYRDEFNYSNDELKENVHNSDVKNPIGYTGIASDGIPSGFISKGVVKLQRKYNCSINKLRKMKLITDDHLFGTTLIGRIVLEAFIDSGCNIDYMVNGWLPDHLYLWSRAIITREEHKADNLGRNTHSYEDKLCMIHYLEANIVLTGTPNVTFPDSIMQYIYSPYKANTGKFFE